MRGSGKAQDLGWTCGSGAQDRKRGSVLKWGLAVIVEDRFVKPPGQSESKGWKGEPWKHSECSFIHCTNPQRAPSA